MNSTVHELEGTGNGRNGSDESFHCHFLLDWWEPKSDMKTVVGFNWKTLQQLKDAVTVFLSARISAAAARARAMLSERKYEEVKAIMASNPNTAEDILNYLAQNGPSHILVRVAENRSCSAETLKALATSSCAEVRMACTENRQLPFEALDLLARDKSPDVRYRLAENARTPSVLLRLLVDDENPYVSQRALRTLERVASSHSLESSHDDGYLSSAESAKEFLQEIRSIYDLALTKDAPLTVSA